MEIVSNTSSIVFLAKLNIFYLAKNIFSKIIIPKEVFIEIMENPGYELNIIEKELDNFIQIAELKNIKELPIHLGEKAAISLCIEKNINKFLSDDKKTRDYAESLDIEVIGILGIIIKNTKDKKLKKQDALKIINDLIKNDFYISSDLYLEIIKEIDSI